MSNLHFHYDQLTDAERAGVDDVVGDLRESLRINHDCPTHNDDRCEELVDAIAKAVIEGRDLKQPVQS